jgi:5-methylcytosine-specific restriction endonuclease McrA
MGRLYNGGSWTEGRYRGFITSALRSAMRRWPPKWEVLKAAYIETRKNKRTGRLAKHYRCNACTKLYVASAVQVDHKIPIGSCSTWDEFIERLFCEAENLQVLCKPCHKAKTKAEVAGRASDVTKLVTSKKKTKNDRKANRKK